MIRLSRAILLVLSLLAFLPAAAGTAHAGGKWALYSWIDNGQWQFSLIRRTGHHPDKSEVQASATDSIDKIETRLALLEPGSAVSLNPLPVLNLELHRPGFFTLKEFERVCSNAKISLED